MFDVVSCPAISSSPAMPISSSVLRSSPWSRTSMPSMSSPGAACARATRSAMYSRLSRPSSRRSSIGSEMSSSGWCAPGTTRGRRRARPSSSQITSDGIGSAKSATRSAGRPGLLHRVEVVVDDLDDPRLQPAHPADRELRGEHPAQAGVLGRVDAEQVARPHPVALLVAQLRGPGGVEGPAAVVAEPGAVGEHGLDVRVPGDQERGHPEGRLHLPDALVVAQRRHLGHRVEPVAPHVQREHLGSLAGLLLQRLRHRRTSFARSDTSTLPTKR